jgi:hypothetical protein
MSRAAEVGVLVAAVFATVLLSSRTGFANADAGDNRELPATELGRLSDLDVELRRILRAEQNRLVTGCEFAAISQRLLDVRADALDAVRILTGLYTDGRLRNGGLAMSELLLDKFDGLISDVRRDSELAKTLASLQRLVQGGAPNARTQLARIIEVHPSPPICLTRLIQVDPATVSAPWTERR